MSTKYIFANHKIYNVETLINNHPGGSTCILKKLGTDCTQDYNFHSNSAKINWEKYVVNTNTDTSEYISCCILL